MAWDQVYQLVKRIPRGRVTTYGKIAAKLRLPGGARVVGYAMASCPSGKGIPWHRVIGANGKILIGEPHASLQRRLLESEGISTRNNAIDLDLYSWSPAKKRSQSSKRPKSSKRRFARKSRL
jgi:methylated-DNA-protein-cysteine methyltransferase-like protein